MKTLTKTLALGLLLAGGYTSVQAQITISMSAYQSSNKLADGVTNVGDTTIMKVGYFYNSGFTSASALQTAWGSLTGSMQSRLNVFDDTFVSLKADNGIALETTAGEFDPGMGQFWIALDPNGNESASRFVSTLSVGTSNQTLNGISLINVKPFVWVETADRSQFGLYESTKAMPSGAFPDLSLDLVMSSSTFTAVVGTLNTRSFNLSAIPEPNTSVLLGLGLLSFLVNKRRNNLRV